MSSIHTVFQVCTICLDTDSKLYVMSEYKMDKAYEYLTGLSLSNMEHAKFLCFECVHRLLSFSKFRCKSLRARLVMENLLKNYTEITLQHIKSIDRNLYRLNSGMVKILLEPDNCDLYIDNSDVDKLVESATEYINDRAVEEMINDEVLDSMMVGEEHTQQNTDIGYNNNNNTDIQMGLDTGLENVIVKTEQNLYDDLIDIKTENVVSENDNCDNTMDSDAANYDYLSESTLVLDAVPSSDEQTFMSTETQNSDMDTENLDLKKEQNAKAANVVRIKEKMTCKRDNKLHDKLKFESTSENSAVSDELFKYEEIPKRESGMETKGADCSSESNSDNEENSLLVKREGKHDSVKLKKSTETNAYSCDICNYKCKLKISLTFHMKSHESKKLFSCEICDYKSTLRHTLNVHMRTHTNETPFACDICKSKFKTTDELALHSRSHASEMSFSCAICDYKCKLRHTLNVHMSKHKSETHLVCGICGTKFQLRSNLIRHMKSHSREKPFACDLCEYKSVHRYNLKIHQAVHAKSYACGRCQQKFAHKKSLERHNMWIHMEKKYIECELCDFKCQDRTDLRMHMRCHDESPLAQKHKRAYACHLCESKFKQSHHLDRHLKMHSGDKPFKCTSCKLQFTQKVTLKKHMYLHTGVKPFSCETCPYKCTSNVDLVKHMRTHTGEKPYACTYCDYKSTTSYSLLTHTRGHTGEKPFACNICHYKCSSTSQLVRHMRTHTGEKRFSCGLCDYKCTRHCNLQTHIRVHTGDMFSCDYCDYKTAHKSCLLVHIRRHMKLIEDSQAGESQANK